MERFGPLLDDGLSPVADIDTLLDRTTIEFLSVKRIPFFMIIEAFSAVNVGSDWSDWLNDEYLFHHHTICSLGIAYCKMEGMLCVVAEA